MLRNVYLTVRKRGTQIILSKCSSNTALDIEKLEKEAESLEVVDNEAIIKEEQLEKKRNKSRLNPAHRNILYDVRPYVESQHPSHNTFRYKRKMYGRYGVASGLDARLCWPTREELVDRIEYEKVAYPHTIAEMIQKAKKQQAEKNAKILKREEEIANKMLKLDTWIRELNAKIAKKESDAREAKERKEKLIEEVRRHFGYTIDPRDDKFKEMLEKKEKEQKKAMKEARKKAKEEQMVTKILAKKDEIKTENTTKQNLDTNTK